MSPTLINHVRELNATARPATGDVAATFADHLIDTPRERFVLVAIAAQPDADMTQLAAMTAMSKMTVKEAVTSLLKDGAIYLTVRGGYLTVSAAVIA